MPIEYLGYLLTNYLKGRGKLSIYSRVLYLYIIKGPNPAYRNIRI
jgi:hypothetical protein